MGYARERIGAIAGYVPGEQPKEGVLIKLNTNENPYPPSPSVMKALAGFDATRLRLYPEPSARMVREAASRALGVSPDQIICGNGSDDLLTIALRTFVGENEGLAYTEPSYSLYPVLADLQGAARIPVQLDDDFNLPADAVQQAGNARLFLIANPNAPTGNAFPADAVRDVCRNFKGVVWIDEAYVDFAESNCLGLVNEFPNVIVSRTLSKSYSLAGLRLGLAIANRDLVLEMNKVKDSYNVDMLAQTVGAAALDDSEYMRANARRICETRAWLSEKLSELGCRVLPSSTNFIFVEPRTPASAMFAKLRDNGFLVRYFNLPRISGFIRITIGRREDMVKFYETFRELDK